jgi:hypothetical protein
VGRQRRDEFGRNAHVLQTLPPPAGAARRPGRREAGGGERSPGRRPRASSAEAAAVVAVGQRGSRSCIMRRAAGRTGQIWA